MARQWKNISQVSQKPDQAKLYYKDKIIFPKYFREEDLKNYSLWWNGIFWVSRCYILGKFYGGLFHLVSKIVSKGWLEKSVTLRKWYLRVAQVLNTWHTFYLVFKMSFTVKGHFEKWPTLVKWYLLGVQVLSFPPNPISICHCTDRGRYKGWTQTIICEGFFTQISRKQHVCKNMCKLFLFLSPKPFTPLFYYY